VGRLSWIVAGVTAMGLLIAGCGGSGGSADVAGSQGEVAVEPPEDGVARSDGAGGAGDAAATGDGGATDDAAASRPAAPPIEGTTLDGERISLADFRGRPVFVNVWSSW
jgi:hypothetical protein